MMAISLWTFLGRGKWASSVNGLCRLSHRSPWYHSASLYMCTGEGLLVGVKLFCYLLCSSLCFTFFGNEWPKSSIAQTVFVYLYNSCQGDIFSSSNGLVVSFPARGEPNSNRPANGGAWDRRLWLLSTCVFTMERFVGLCCMPLTTQREGSVSIRLQWGWGNQCHIQGSVLRGGHRVESMQLGKELCTKIKHENCDGIYDEGAYNWGLNYSQILCGSL